MSIDALRYDALAAKLPIESCLKMLLDVENKSKATADDLSEAWYHAMQKYTSPEEALEETVKLFDMGHNLDMVKCISRNKKT